MMINPTIAKLQAAKLRYPGAVEDIDFRSPRGLNRAVVLDLAGAGWVTRHQNLVVTGPTGVGKSFLACALANAALRQGHTALYVRTPRLLDELALGRADGRYVRVLNQLGRVSLLLLDDFLLTPAPVEACRDLLEVIEDRAQRRSTLVASQLPVEKWHAAMADPALGEAVLDRVLQAAHRITLKGPSMRKRQPPAETCRETSPSEHHLDPQATRSDPQVRAPRASEPIRRPTLPGEHDAPIVCHEEATTEPQTH